MNGDFYTIPFGLNPVNTEPSGTLSMYSLLKRVLKVSLKEIDGNPPKAFLNIIALCYNIFYFENGDHKQVYKL